MSRQYLLDTCVICEATLPQAAGTVLDWMERHAVASFLPAISVGEICFGIRILPAGQRREHLQEWCDGLLRVFADRILAVDAEAARCWSHLRALRRGLGHPLPLADGLIAATAKVHDLALVTRNLTDFQDLGLELIDPWQAGPHV
jgi:hypothetical protein